MPSKKIKATKQKPKIKAKKTVKVKAKPKITKPVKKAVVKKPLKKMVKKPAKKIPAPIKKKEAKPVAKKEEKKKVVKPVIAEKSIKKEEVKKESSSQKDGFKVGEYAVYPSHGVGKITAIENTKIMGKDFNCYLMFFERERLTIKVPFDSAKKVGLRHLSSKAQLEEVLSILRSGVKKLKGMWSRRAQEYETKINSGDIILLAEVLRDLTRDIEDGERSYSERIIYETAINRLASEYSAVYSVSFEEAKEKVIITAKDKLMSEPKAPVKDDFDDFDRENEDGEEEGESDDEDDEEDDDDFEDDDFDDDEKPRKKRK